MKIFGFTVISCFTLLLAIGGPAAATDGAQTNNVDAISHFLTGNEPSYFVMSRDEGDTSSHAEFYLSIKYPLLQRPIRFLLGEASMLYFNYNGLYDFYLGTRNSSPIISRRQNPGLMYEYQFLNHEVLRKAKFGYFHESNGQTIDTEADYLNATDAKDYVSRGWDYLHLELSATPRQDWYLYMQGRRFLDKQMFQLEKEEKWPWEPPIGQSMPIQDYDGIRFIVSRMIKGKYWTFDSLKLSAIYRTGYRDFGHNSTRRFEATFRVFDIPLYMYYFDGYGINISSYYKKSSAYGIGFELW